MGCHKACRPQLGAQLDTAGVAQLSGADIGPWLVQFGRDKLGRSVAPLNISFHPGEKPGVPSSRFDLGRHIAPHAFAEFAPRSGRRLVNSVPSWADTGRHSIDTAQGCPKSGQS